MGTCFITTRYVVLASFKALPFSRYYLVQDKDASSSTARVPWIRLANWLCCRDNAERGLAKVLEAVFLALLCRKQQLWPIRQRRNCLKLSQHHGRDSYFLFITNPQLCHPLVAIGGHWWHQN